MTRTDGDPVLITGAAGNLGGLLARHLMTRAYPLRLMYHHRLPATDVAGAPNVTSVQADLADPRTLVHALRGAGVVVHFAGVLFAPRPERFLPITNTLWFSNLLAAGLEAGVKRIVLISFPHVEGPTSVEQPVTLQQFLDEACDVWGYPRPFRVPVWLVYASAAACELVAWIARTKAPFTRDFIRIGRVPHWGDTRRARQELIPSLVHPNLASGRSTL